jgi:hypothetical protein
LACKLLLLVVTAYALAATIATILQCSPVSRAWDKNSPSPPGGGGGCFNVTAFWYANAIYAVVTDLVLLAMPVRIIWSLTLRVTQKVAILLVFALGGVVTVCSVVRITYIPLSSTSTDYTCELSLWTFADFFKAHHSPLDGTVLRCATLCPSCEFWRGEAA